MQNVTERTDPRII